MPWTEKDYPESLKNFDETTRRKAIDIANAMVADGYDEDRAIPIATARVKEWALDADPKEKRELQDKDITTHEGSTDRAKLQDADVIVSYREDEDQWEVRSRGAERADSLHETKQAAEKRAKEVSEYRDGEVISKRKSD